jgi:hypothetical protein
MVGNPIAGREHTSYDSNVRTALHMPIWLLAILGGAVTSCGSRTELFIAPTGVPPVAVAPKPVDRTGCPDPSATYIYLVTEENELFSFYPPDLSFQRVGNLSCPGVNGATPFSMAVDRRGQAYVLFDDGSLFAVSTATAACIPTSFVPNQMGFGTFGMSFASDTGGPAERLYISDDDSDGVLRGLGVIDTKTFEVDVIGPSDVPFHRSELTGTGDGRLFAFWPDMSSAAGSHLSELDKTTGGVVAQTDLAISPEEEDAFAFAFYGGDFWIFTSGGGGPSLVHRFRPSDGTLTVPTMHPSTIVGAGVSTCAPQL